MLKKKLVRSSLLVLDINEACIKADVLKQHITPPKPLAQRSASTKYLTQTPTKQTNQQQLILISNQTLS
jgi:hypothetical protein